MTEVRARIADDGAAREDAFAVRRDVFVDEQGVDEDLEWDEWDDDPATTHFVAYATDANEEGGEEESSDEEAGDGESPAEESGGAWTPVGAARLRPKDRDTAEVGKVERVAVAADYRERGVGRALMDALEAHGRERGFDSFFLHSQTTAADFYAELGYEREGEPFDEAGIPHVKMRKPA